MIRRILFSCAILFFTTSLLATAQETTAGKKRIVTIQSAQSTEYIKRTEPKPPKTGLEENIILEETEEIDTSEQSDISKEREVNTGTFGDEVIRLRGGVSILVTEGSSISSIAADEIIYDKGRDTLEARGSVVYEHTTGKKGFQRFEGKALLFDIKKQEGVFLDGVVTQDSGKKDGDPFIIHSEITGRDTSSTIAFKKGVLTTCDDEDPHWSIRASRIWLLPGNEIALLNGVFFVGPLPVFYIPFFYYPGDEMIFHPVFGYRNREGYFVQTTTYLRGRKPLPKKGGPEESSFTDFLQGDVLKEQKREGLFFRNLEEDAKNANSDYFKIMVDAYSSLGAMVGFDGVFTGKGYVRNFSILGSIGFSKTLYEPTSGISYSTYDSLGEENFNSGYFFGKKIPFRYRTEMRLSMDKQPFQITASLPLISDPKYKKDFFDRSEDLNWFKLLFDQDELSKNDKVDNDESSYSWNIAGSIRPTLTSTQPWLQTFSITTISGLLTFNSKTNQNLSAQERLYSPERTFYYPELIRPEIRMTLGGTLYSSRKNLVPEKLKPLGTTGKLENPFLEKDEKINEKKEKIDTDEEKDFDERFNRFVPHPSSVVSSTPAIMGNEFTVTWALDPTFIHEARYDSSEWKSTEDIDWNNFSSLFYQFKTAARLRGDYSYDSNFLKISTALNFTGTYQEHPWLSDELYNTPEKINMINKADYMASTYTVKTTETARLIPFHRDALFKPVSFAWSFSGDILKEKFIGTVEEPKWELEPFKWKKDFVNTHETISVLGVSLGAYDQKFTFTNNLPPLHDSYKGSLYLSWLFGNMNASSRFFERETGDETQWIWDPFRIRFSWNIPPGITLSQEYVYDLEEERHTQLNFTAAYKYISGYYTLASTIPFEMIEGQGWIQKGVEQEFIPTACGLAFNNSSKPLEIYTWKNRIALQARVASNLKFDLVKLTESSFTFSPIVTFKIYEFLDLSFSSTSSNEVIARYFQGFLDLPDTIPGETNIFTDLLNSINFFDTNARKGSGFKLKSLNFDLTHYLHDWTMNLRTSLKPEVKKTGNRYRYEFIPIITFVVQWKPVSDIKTKVRSEEGVFSLNVNNEDDD